MQKLLILILVPVCLLLPASCGGETLSSTIFTVDLAEKPVNLDPQLAQNEAELFAAANAFEGLMRIAADGSVLPLAAQTVSVSGDALSYTFTLNPENGWSSGDKVTANDYVFGLRRALSPEIKAPSAPILFAIQNAEKVYNGSLPPEELGVFADDDFTVRVSLSAPDSGFLSALAAPVSMPCQQKFFLETSGRYGLTAEHITSNGSYYITDWNDKLIRLRRNKHYAGSVPAGAAGVTAYFTEDGQERLKRVTEGVVDAASVSPADTAAAKAGGRQVNENWNQCFAICINQTDAGVGVSEIAWALRASLDPGNYADDIPAHYRIADGFIPPGFMVFGHAYRDCVNLRYDNRTDIAAARSQYSKAILKLKNKQLPKTTLLYPENAELKRIASLIVHGWQKNLNATVNIEGLVLNQLHDKVNTGDYQLALVPLSSRGNLAEDFLSQFVSAVQNGIPGGAGFDRQFAQIRKASGFEETVLRVAEAEKALFASRFLIPVLYGTSCHAFSSRISGIDFTGGVPDFRFAGLAQK